MTDYQIPASAIEAATEALAGRSKTFVDDSEPAWWNRKRREADVALRAAFDELRMERIECDGILFSSIEPKLYLRGWRFESRWMPMEKP